MKILTIADIKTRKQRTVWLSKHFSHLFSKNTKTLDIGCDEAPLRKLIGKQKYTGITMTKESDSYKISIQPSNITQKSTNINTDSKTNTEPQTTTPNNTSSNGDSIKSQLEKIMYTPIQNQIKTTSESIHSDEILLEEIFSILNLFFDFLYTELDKKSL